jgi:hypothetical protein
MTTAVVEADPRTDLVRGAADNVEHTYCDNCGSPDGPMMCGTFDFGDECPDGGDCDHPKCSMCEIEWKRHLTVDC